MPDDGGEVVFCNENPTMILSAGGNSVAAVAVSFWQVSLSPVGPGHLFALWQRPPGIEVATTSLYTDNRALAPLIHETFLRHFTWTPFASARAEQAEYREAQFWVSANPPRVYRAACHALGIDLLAEWREIGPFVRHGRHGHPGVAYGGAPLVVDAAVGFSGRASLMVDGRPLPGSEGLHGPGGAAGATAFVTLGETWSRATPSE